MEVARPISEGLRHLKLTGKITDEEFKGLAQRVFDSAAGSIPESKDDGSGSVEGKESFAALLTVVLEAAKHNSSSDELRSILEDAEVSDDRITQLCKLLDRRREEIRNHLSQFHLGIPNLVGINWRLDYYLKSEILEQTRLPVYFVTLETRTGDGSRKDIQMTCSFPELQDLLDKVRDALKQAEKLHSVNQ